MGFCGLWLGWLSGRLIRQQSQLNFLRLGIISLSWPVTKRWFKLNASRVMERKVKRRWLGRKKTKTFSMHVYWVPVLTVKCAVTHWVQLFRKEIPLLKKRGFSTSTGTLFKFYFSKNLQFCNFLTFSIRNWHMYTTSHKSYWLQSGTVVMKKGSWAEDNWKWDKLISKKGT